MINSLNSAAVTMGAETPAATGTDTDSAKKKTAKTAEETTVSKDAFLQLLVAQVKNQDPLNPTDGVQFLTQLAQFSQLEQTIGLRDDFSKLAEALDPTSDANVSGAFNV